MPHLPYSLLALFRRAPIQFAEVTIDNGGGDLEVDALEHFQSDGEGDAEGIDITGVEAAGGGLHPGVHGLIHPERHGVFQGQ